jgi:hypothetical protein
MMSPRLATRLGFIRRPGFLFYVLFWVVLVNVIWDPVSVWQHTSVENPAATDPRDTFDLQLPVAIEPGPEGPRSGRDPIDPQPIPSPSKSPSVAARPPESLRGAPGVDPRKLRRIMDLGVVRYASASDVPGKTKGASLIQLSALLGYSPALDLVVRNYPRSPAVRNAVPVQDAVRFAVDLLGQDAAPFKETAELAIALGNYFSRRGDVLRFARHIVDAIADDDRLQSPDYIAMLGSVFGRVPGVCTGVKRVVSADMTIDKDECSDSWREQLLQYVRSKGEVGIDAAARQRAMPLLEEVDGIGK